MLNNKKEPNAESRIPSVDETNARIEKEFAKQYAKTENSGNIYADKLLRS
jgi:hypothetical protein